MGSSPRSRRYLDRWQNVIIIPDPTTEIGYHSYVTEWRIYSERKVNGRRKEKVLFFKPSSAPLPQAILKQSYYTESLLYLLILYFQIKYSAYQIVKRFKLLNSVIKYHYFKVFAQVWRPAPGSTSATSTKARFELVGQTAIKYRTRGTYAIADRIQVNMTGINSHKNHVNVVFMYDHLQSLSIWKIHSNVKHWKTSSLKEVLTGQSRSIHQNLFTTTTLLLDFTNYHCDCRLRFSRTMWLGCTFRTGIPSRSIRVDVMGTPDSTADILATYAADGCSTSTRSLITDGSLAENIQSRLL